jgi:hypothetical protein
MLPGRNTGVRLHTAVSGLGGVRLRLLVPNPCPDCVSLPPKRRVPVPRPSKERKIKPLDRCFLFRDKLAYNRTYVQNPVWIDRPSMPNGFCF